MCRVLPAVVCLILASPATADLPSCPEPQIQVNDGRIVAVAGADEESHGASFSVWESWIHFAESVQIDADPELEFVVVSRSSGTGPYYRLQIVDFRCTRSDVGIEVGFVGWSYPSEGKPRVENGEVLLGVIPRDLWTSKGPAVYIRHVLTSDGLEAVAPVDEPSCTELPAAAELGGASHPTQVTLEIEGVDGSVREQTLEVETTVGKSATPEGAGCSIEPRIVRRNSAGETLFETSLRNSYCGDIGLWSGTIWRLGTGGALAALELGNTTFKNATGDLHLVLLGRDATLRELFVLREASGHGSSASFSVDTELEVRAFSLGDTTLVRVEAVGIRREFSAADRVRQAQSRSARWFELGAQRARLVELPSDHPTPARCVR